MRSSARSPKMFVIVRHGNTFEAGVEPRRIGARTDLDLTECGVKQAKALARHFATEKIHFGKALVSPLARTQQTARIILASQTLPPELEPCDFLREIDHGPDENRTEGEVIKRIGKAALDAWESLAEAPAGWEVDAEMRLAAWRKLFSQPPHSNQPILLVTSNGAARFALAADPDLWSAAQALKSLKLPTGGYGMISRDQAGRLIIDSWGIRP